MMKKFDVDKIFSQAEDEFGNFSKEKLKELFSLSDEELIAKGYGITVDEYRKIKNDMERHLDNRLRKLIETGDSEIELFNDKIIDEFHKSNPGRGNRK